MIFFATSGCLHPATEAGPAAQQPPADYPDAVAADCCLRHLDLFARQYNSSSGCTAALCEHLASSGSYSRPKVQCKIPRTRYPGGAHLGWQRDRYLRRRAESAREDNQNRDLAPGEDAWERADRVQRRQLRKQAMFNISQTFSSANQEV